MKIPGKRARVWDFALRRGHPGAELVLGLALAISPTWFSSCHPSRPIFSPLPAQVNSIEGYASLKLTRGGETARARISFLFLMSEQGHIEIQGSLGRAAARLFLMKDGAILVLPSQRVYWRASLEEAMEKLLGFALKLEEMTDILQGRWDRLIGWDLERDERQRVIRGRREHLQMEVKEFFDATSLPQRLMLSRNGEKGHLRILRLRFNQPLRKGVFDFSFLQENDYRPCTWEEIERLMRDED